MRAGMNEETGQLIEGWAHCAQSIRLILTSRRGTWVMMRDFGSILRELQDRNPSRRVLMAAYAGIADALIKFEPGYRLQQIALERSGPDGVYVFRLDGIFYPRGHLGDYSVQEAAGTTVGVRELTLGSNA